MSIDERVDSLLAIEPVREPSWGVGNLKQVNEVRRIVEDEMVRAGEWLANANHNVAWGRLTDHLCDVLAMQDDIADEPRAAAQEREPPGVADVERFNREVADALGLCPPEPAAPVQDGASDEDEIVIRAAYYHGYMARKDGVPRDRNPHPFVGDQADEAWNMWDNGWFLAAAPVRDGALREALEDAAAWVEREAGQQRTPVASERYVEQARRLRAALRVPEGE
jgi:hypothetical protein